MSSSPSAWTLLATSLPPLAIPLRINLSVMMFLQFAIWGAWFVVFFPYLPGSFTGDAGRRLMGNMALGAIFSTIFAGYIADRFIASEKLMAICHLLGAGCFTASPRSRRPDEYGTLFALTFGYALLYNPTLVLANSITFRHVPDGQRRLPRHPRAGHARLDRRRVHHRLPVRGRRQDRRQHERPAPARRRAVGRARRVQLLPAAHAAEGTGRGHSRRQALGLFRDFSFAVFFVVSLVITIVLAFYYVFTADFLETARSAAVTSRTRLDDDHRAGVRDGLPAAVAAVPVPDGDEVGARARHVLLGAAVPAVRHAGAGGVAVGARASSASRCTGSASTSSSRPGSSTATTRRRRTSGQRPGAVQLPHLRRGMWLGSMLAGVLRDSFTAKKSLTATTLGDDPGKADAMAGARGGRRMPPPRRSRTGSTSGSRRASACWRAWSCLSCSSR